MFIFKTRYIFLWITIFLSGCSQWLFYPHSQIIRTPADVGLTYEDVWLTTQDKITLHGWWLPAPTTAKATLYFLHGNAENISTHLANVYWLPEAGYNVFLLDYRGYGRSQGEPKLPDVLNDLEAGMQWVIGKNKNSHTPIFVLAQSLGGALGVYYVGSHPAVQKQISGLVIDAAFASYHDIAREKLASFWLTWPLQYPLSWTLPDQYSPQAVTNTMASIPILFFHSRDDGVVPIHHGQALFEQLPPPKTWIETRGLHTATFDNMHNRKILEQFLIDNTGK